MMSKPAITEMKIPDFLTMLICMGRLLSYEPILLSYEPILRFGIKNACVIAGTFTRELLSSLPIKHQLAFLDH
jgi:hypothetical protein